MRLALKIFLLRAFVVFIIFFTLGSIGYCASVLPELITARFPCKRECNLKAPCTVTCDGFNYCIPFQDPEPTHKFYFDELNCQLNQTTHLFWEQEYHGQTSVTVISFTLITILAFFIIFVIQFFKKINALQAEQAEQADQEEPEPPPEHEKVPLLTVQMPDGIHLAIPVSV